MDPKDAHLSRLTAGWILCLTFALFVLGGCGSGESSATPRVFFISPHDGAAVSSPVQIDMGAEQFMVEPAGDGAVHPGAGHLHLMIDTPCVAVGQTIPKDDNHRHFGDGSTTTTLDLPPGSHSICLQAADGAHTALAGLQQSITVEVK